MQRGLGRAMIKGMTRGLAIDGCVPPRRLQMQLLTNGVDPVNKTVAKCLRVEMPEDTIECIMRGDAVGQFQEGIEKCEMVVPVGFHLLPSRGTTDNATNSGGDDVEEKMVTATNDARIGQRLEVLHDRNRIGWNEFTSSMTHVGDANSGVCMVLYSRRTLRLKSFYCFLHL